MVKQLLQFKVNLSIHLGIAPCPVGFFVFIVIIAGQIGESQLSPTHLIFELFGQKESIQKWHVEVNAGFISRFCDIAQIAAFYITC